MAFLNWQKRLAGETITAYLQPQLEDEGYYRKPITEPVLGPNGKTNGQKRIIGWTPVAYFIDDGMLRGVIGDRDMAANEVTDEGLWSYVCRHPITEKVYRAVAEKGEPWPDASPAAAFNKDIAQAEPATFTHSTVAAGGTTGSTARVVEIGDNSNAAPVVEPHVEHGEAIDNAVKAALDLKVTDETSASILLGAINRIAELRLAADKAGHAIYDPLHAAYAAEQKKWPGMVKKAKDTETALNRRYLEWRAAEKKKADDAERERLAEIVRIEEANARAADRAIGRGEPEPEPVDPEEVLPAPTPAPAPVAPTYRAAGQRTAPKEIKRWWLDGVDDQAKVYEFFKNHAAVGAVLFNLAADATKNGQEVPGTRRHFGLI